MYHAGHCSRTHHGHHASHGEGHHGGCCCHPAHGTRRFPSRAEILTELEEYLGQLQEEIKAVEAQIADFSKAEKKQG